MMKFSKMLPAVFLLLLSLKNTIAHCPLCTAGVAVAAGGALWLGVDLLVIALLIGAFAVSTGWWLSKYIRKQYIPQQKTAIILLSLALTVLPMLALPVFNGITPFHISWFGSYGSLFNRTYLLNTFLLGSILGGTIVCLTPWLSKKISQLRNGKMIPFQGVMLTLLLLIAAGVLLQVTL